MKEGIYFPHFSSSRNDRKIKRLRKSLGIEGYAIFFMLLEVLREQEEFKYPVKDIDLLADDFDTTEDKVKVVIFNFELFNVDADDFFSPKLVENLEPYLQGKEQKKIGGIKGNLLRHGHLTKEQLSKMTTSEILDFNENLKSDSSRLLVAMREQTESDSGRLTSQKKEKENKKKEKEIKKDIYRAFAHLSLSLSDFQKLIEMGYSKNQIDDVLDSIENWKRNKDYKNLFITCKNWLKKDVNPNPVKKEVKNVEDDWGYAQ